MKRKNKIKYIGVSALTLSILAASMTIQGDNVKAKTGDATQSQVQNKNGGVESTSLNDKQTKGTVISANSLIDEGIITVDSVDWKKDVSSSYSYNEGLSQAPSGFQITINPNSKLKSGDTISLGQPTYGGRFYGVYALKISKKILPGIGTIEGERIYLDDTYDGSSAKVISSKNFDYGSGPSINSLSTDFTNATSTFLRQTVNIKLSLDTPIAKPVSELRPWYNQIWAGSYGTGIRTAILWGNDGAYYSMLNNPNDPLPDKWAFPSQPIIEIARFHADSNILNVTTNEWTTSDYQVMPDGKNLAKNGRSGNPMNIHNKLVTLPADLTNEEIAKQLPVGKQAVIKNSDGSWTTAVNYGVIGSKESVQANRESMSYEYAEKTTQGGAYPVRSVVLGQPWEAPESVYDQVLKNLGESNTINGSVAYREFTQYVNLADSSLDKEYTTDYYSTGVGDGDINKPFNSTTQGNNKAETESNGQTVVKYKFVDTKGQPIKTIESSVGWGVSNTQNKPVESYDYTAASSITGADGLHYHLVPESSDGQGHVSGQYLNEKDPIKEYTFVYDVNDGADVTAKYQTESGKSLASDATFKGKEGATYQTENKTFKGYTLTKVPSNASGKFTDKAQTVTYVYKANVQKGSVRYVDMDDNNKVLSTDKLTGVTDQATSYDVKVPAGYDFTKVTFDSGKAGTYANNKISFTYDNDDAVDQNMTVYLKHHHTKITDGTAANNSYTVKYLVNGKADSRVPNSVTKVKWNSDRDDVTKVTTYTPDKKDISVTSPDLKGYTVSDKVVSWTNNSTTTKPVDQEKTVKYTSDAQKGSVRYVDDDAEGKVLSTDQLSGVTDQAASYDVKVPAGYDFTKVTFDSGKAGTYANNKISFIYDNDSSVDQNMTVHLKHHHTKVTDGVKTKATVKYVFDDKKTPNTPNFEDVIHDLSWNTDKDEVTGVTTYTPQDYKKRSANLTVTSPEAKGFTVSDKSVSFSATTTTTKPVDQEKTVKYTRNAYKTTVKYIDDLTGKQVGTDTTIDGKFDIEDNYDIKIPDSYWFVSVKSDDIKLNIKDLHVSWTNENHDNSIIVHLKHKIATSAKKEVLDEEGKNIDKSEIQIGQKIQYKITATFDNTPDNVSRGIVDDLDDRLDLSTIKVVDSEGKDITKEGKLEIEEDKKLFNWTPNDTEKYAGKTVVLTADSKLDKNEVIHDLPVKNTAGVITEDEKVVDSNEVENTVPEVDSSAKKTVSTLDGKDIEGKEIKSDTEYQWNVETQFDNDFDTKERSISDDLDNRLDLKDVKVLDDKGEDITKSGTLTRDEDKESVEWKSEDPNLAGKKVTMTITWKLKDDTILYDKEITNIAQVGKDDKTTDSNGSTVVVPDVKSAIKKSVTDEDGKNVEGKVVQKGETYVYELLTTFPNLDDVKSLLVNDDLDDEWTITDVKVYSNSIADQDRKEVAEDPSDSDEAIEKTTADEKVDDTTVTEEVDKSQKDAKYNIDVTKEGQLELDDENESVQWSPEKIADYKGRTVKVKVFVKLKDDVKEDGSAIKNVAIESTNDKETKSNEVSVDLVTPEVKEDPKTPEKLEDAKPNEDTPATEESSKEVSASKPEETNSSSEALPQTGLSKLSALMVSLGAALMAGLSTLVIHLAKKNKKEDFK